VTASHGVLDAMTDGGLGIAFFAPFDNTRYFFPFRPVKVSPIGLSFFSARGLDVIWSELLWAPRKIATARRAPQNYPQMIPICSCCDS
jgi:membrane-bound metal-dependent hydrolase YbcI (DUF457 family)